MILNIHRQVADLAFCSLGGNRSIICNDKPGLGPALDKKEIW